MPPPNALALRAAALLGRARGHLLEALRLQRQAEQAPRDYATQETLAMRIDAHRRLLARRVDEATRLRLLQSMSFGAWA